MNEYVTYSRSIAELLQGAHQRRQRREDTRMSMYNSPLNIGERVWDDDPYVRAMKLVEELGKTLGDIAASGHAPDENAGRVTELERQLADAKYNAESFRERAEGTSKAHGAALARIEELERQLAQTIQDREASDAAANERDGEHAELRQALDLLATAYVMREIPWRDVAAGMMTISKEEHPTPWMVESHHVGERVFLHNGPDVFMKEYSPSETVRVLVPYVTPEQVESLVKNGLGGTAVT